MIVSKKHMYAKPIFTCFYSLISYLLLKLSTDSEWDSNAF